MAEVIKLYPRGAAKDPDTVLEQAVGVYADVLVIGWDKNGALDVRGNLGLGHRDVLFLVEKFKHKLLAGDYGKEPEE